MTRKPGILYRDRNLSFTVRLPAWWRPYVEVRSSGRGSGASRAVRFLFQENGEVYGEVLTILAYRMSLKRWKRLYDDSPLVPIGQFGGQVYAYTVPEELPYVFVDPETGEYDEERYGEQIRIMKKMVNDDVPAVVKSFRWSGRTAGSATGLPEPYLASGVFPGSSCR